MIRYLVNVCAWKMILRCNSSSLLLTFYVHFTCKFCLFDFFYMTIFDTGPIVFGTVQVGMKCIVCSSRDQQPDTIFKLTLFSSTEYVHRILSLLLIIIMVPKLINRRDKPKLSCNIYYFLRGTNPRITVDEEKHSCLFK